MQIVESRNKREGRYIGRICGTYVRKVLAPSRHYRPMVPDSHIVAFIYVERLNVEFNKQMTKERGAYGQWRKQKQA